VTLTPEERQRIYEEEKARHEAQDRLRAEKSTKRNIGCLFVLVGFVVLIVVAAIIGSVTDSSKTASSTSSPSVPSDRPAMTKAEVMKGVGTMIDALHDMKTAVAGESMDHIKFVLEVFDSGAKLIQKAQAEQLADEERAQVAALRKALVARQRETFPIMRSSFGPIVSSELWIADGSATTFGKRYTVIQFVGGSFAAHANIAKAQQAMHGPLMRLRFKQARYKWYAEEDEYSYYAIGSPADGDIAIIDTDGNVTAVTE